MQNLDCRTENSDRTTCRAPKFRYVMSHRWSNTANMTPRVC